MKMCVANEMDVSVFFKLKQDIQQNRPRPEQYIILAKRNRINLSFLLSMPSPRTKKGLDEIGDNRQTKYLVPLLVRQKPLQINSIRIIYQILRLVVIRL